MDLLAGGLLVQLLLLFLVGILYKKLVYVSLWDMWLRELWNNRHHRGQYKREK